LGLDFWILSCLACWESQDLSENRHKTMKIEIRRIGLEGKKTEPNWTEHDWVEPVFGSVQKLEKNNFGLVIYFGSKPDWTENAHPYSKSYF